MSSSNGTSPTDPLADLAAIAADVGATRIATEASELAVRAAEGRFYVACVGQFKRGKSTLVNALVGDPILPTGVVPITTVPTVLRYGPRRSARVRTRAAGWGDVDPDALSDYVSEEQNPGNAKGVEAVEAFVPSALLATGMCLVDTPGLGSVHEENSTATQAFVPHIDAALVVIGSDPPISGEELRLIEAVGHQVRDLLIVLNKADRVTDAERRAASAFARRVIAQRLGRAVECIYEVSALERTRGGGPARDWDALTETLAALVRSGGESLAWAAHQRGLARLADQLLAVLESERRLLLRPIEESERRLAMLSRTIADAAAAVEDLSVRFRWEEARLGRELAARHEAFVRDVAPVARAELRDAVGAGGRRWGPAFRRQMMDAAVVVARRHVLPWLGAEQAHAEAQYRRIAGRFVRIGNEFLERLAASDDEAMAFLPHALDEERGVEGRSGFAFHELLHVAHPASPLRYLLDVALGVGGRDRLRRSADVFLDDLLYLNASRVANDIGQRVSESRRRLEGEIRLLLRDVQALAEQGLARARQTREAGAAAIEGALARLAEHDQAVRALRLRVGAGGQ